MNVCTNTIFDFKLSTNWPLFVECEKRLRSEGDFLLSNLKKYKKGLIFDAALGIGCESVFLLRNNFKVISNEFYPNLIPFALDHAQKNHVNLDIKSYDWRKLEFSVPPETFDAIILLGNGICMLREINVIRDALNQQFNILKHGGCLIIDERNYQYILDEKEEILKGNFRYSGDYIYCGKLVKGRPIEIDSTNVCFGYFTSDGELVGTIDTYPFASGELFDLLENVGFTNIKTYSNFKEEKNPNADFYTYVAFKE